jgi:hypothetical protein
MPWKYNLEVWFAPLPLPPPCTVKKIDIKMIFCGCNVNLMLTIFEKIA